MIYQLACLIVLLAAVTAAAQPPAEVPPTKLTLSPAAAPSPALKYVLLPELSEQTPGNAALEYYRAFSPEWWHHIRQQKTRDSVNKALHTPLKDLPRNNLIWLESDPMLRQVEHASRREYVDWGMAERLRREGFALLLPDVQGLRQIGTLLAVRARLEIAEGRYDKAVYTIQTGLALARHVGDGVILILDLVGIAIAQEMIAQVEEMIQQPDAANLYWALTELPHPFIDLRKALQGEKLALYAMVPELQSLETARLTAEQQQKLLPVLGGGLQVMYGQTPTWSNRLMGTALVLRGYAEAKKALIAEGRQREEVEALPALQVVLIHSLHQYRRFQDDLFKWHSLPYWEARPRMEQVEKQIHQANLRLEAMPFIDWIPTHSRIVAASVRWQRHIAALRCVEAIRLYAAAHNGKLPATLDAIADVSIPTDPVTGKAFTYRVAGGRAILLAPPPPGEQANPHNTLHYELTLRRNK